MHSCQENIEWSGSGVEQKSGISYLFNLSIIDRAGFQFSVIWVHEGVHFEVWWVSFAVFNILFKSIWLWCEFEPKNLQEKKHLVFPSAPHSHLTIDSLWLQRFVVFRQIDNQKRNCSYSNNSLRLRAFEIKYAHFPTFCLLTYRMSRDFIVYEFMKALLEKQFFWCIKYQSYLITLGSTHYVGTS